jgi:hypothetical protein
MTTRSIGKEFHDIPTIAGAGAVQWMNVGNGVTQL